MAYADQQMSGSKVSSIVIVAIIHVAIGYLLVSGLAIKGAQAVIERVTTIDIEEPPPPEPEDEPPPPPPEQVEVQIPPPVVPPPPVNIPRPPANFQTTQKIDDTPRDIVLDIPKAPPADPGPPAVDRSRGASADGQSRWAARIQGDYPQRAIRREEEGTVGVSVTVGANGRVASCRVSRSSGSSTLDEAACRGMERYARFNPALDKDGNPTTGSYATNIVYQLN